MNIINNKNKGKVVDSVKKNNRYLIIGFSNCGKTYLKNFILLQKQEPILVITKSLNQHANLKAQTSDEIQPIEIYENSIIVFDGIVLSKQESYNVSSFTRSRHKNIDFYYISQSCFHLPKSTLRIKSNILILFKQFLRDIILLFHGIAGLDMNLEEWKKLCRKAWQNDYDYLQIDRFAKIGEGSYTITNCRKNTYEECTPETKTS